METQQQHSERKRAWLQDAKETGLLAARKNFFAGVALWIFGITIVVSYYNWPSARALFDQVSELKIAWGFFFSILSTAIFGGLIPSLITAISNGYSFTRNVYLTLTNVGLWGFKGIELDLLYRGQAYVFGADNQISTIAFKTLFDQLIYVPLIGLTNVILFVLWRDLNFSCRRFRAALGPNWYANRILPVIISNWFLWVPAVVLIYSLPTSLQLPIQNLVLVFWNLILFFFTTRRN